MGGTDHSRELLPALAVLPGHLFWRASARVQAALAEVLPTGVDIHAYAALLALAGGVTRTQQSVAETISVSRTTMVKVAGDLASERLVKRVRNPDDRRSYALSRTPEGAAAARRWRRHAEDLEDSITAGFSLAEREELCALLVRVADVDLAPDVPEPLRESIAFLVTRIHARLHRQYAAALEPLGVEPRHFGTLSILQSVGPVSQAELGRHLGVSGASVVQIVDDLEGVGLLERRRTPGDRRTQMVHLRDGADEVVTRAKGLSEAILAVEFAALSAREERRLVALLRRFVTAP